MRGRGGSYRSPARGKENDLHSAGGEAVTLSWDNIGKDSDIRA